MLDSSEEESVSGTLGQTAVLTWKRKAFLDPTASMSVEPGPFVLTLARKFRARSQSATRRSPAAPMSALAAIFVFLEGNAFLGRRAPAVSHCGPAADPPISDSHS